MQGLIDRTTPAIKTPCATFRSTSATSFPKSAGVIGSGIAPNLGEPCHQLGGSFSALADRLLRMSPLRAACP